MPTIDPDHIVVSSTDDVVQVEGLTQDEVEFALELAHEVKSEQMRARTVLSTHVQKAMLDGLIPLVPHASQRQVQRNADVRRRLLADEGAETFSSLAELRGTTESSARTWITRSRKTRRMFTVEVQGRTLIPSVLLMESGDIDARVSSLCRPLIDAGLDGWELWSWLTSPNGLLSGAIPARVARSNPHRAHRAAVRHAATVREAASSAETRTAEHSGPRHSGEGAAAVDLSTGMAVHDSRSRSH